MKYKVLKAVCVILSIIVVDLAIYVIVIGLNRCEIKANAETVCFTEETEKTEETEQIESEEVNETTVETMQAESESETGTDDQETTGDDEVSSGLYPDGDEVAEDRIEFPRYDEYGLPDEIRDELIARLKANNIEWWMPYAVAQMFQESHINPMAENKNGLDKGLLQYRITYWSAVCTQHGFPAETSIFDWRVQIAIYTQDTARRLNSGLSIEETISRHKTSDWGSYDALYVSHVMRWVR